MRTVIAVAHRGDPYRARENTLPSLRSALDQGADAVEVDVRLTRDGVPVLLHDATLKRLWEHDAALAALSSAEVRDITDGGVPTLADALDALTSHDAARPAGSEPPRLMIDLPGADRRTVRAIVGVVRDCGAEERAYYCGDAHATLPLRDVAPSAEIALTWTTSAPPRRAVLDAVAPRWLNYKFGLVGQAVAERVHRDGRLLSVWTPDTGRRMRRLLALGVDSITTNRIDVLCATRDGEEAR
ncbi:glycerophosphodiester phosphodiesterase [Streptomyces sp. NPDC050560]|uniref:glycerophosphodiester phosphodiesterase n=1 Tax=Streptomyces sp. NPDC050560 TaxID=3365630 RepID=UPI0037966E0A